MWLDVINAAALVLLYLGLVSIALTQPCGE